MNLNSFIDTTMTFSVHAVVNACAGYVYGAVFKCNKTVAAHAFMISSLVDQIFNLSVDHITKGKQANPLNFHAIHLFGGMALGLIQMIAFRELNLIADLGTVVFSTLLILTSIYHLNELAKLPPRVFS